MSKKHKRQAPYECDRNAHDFMFAAATLKDGSTAPLLGCRYCGDVRCCSHSDALAKRGTK